MNSSAVFLRRNISAWKNTSFSGGGVLAVDAGKVDKPVRADMQIYGDNQYNAFMSVSGQEQEYSTSCI